LSGFEGFQKADFEVFAESCWASHAYNRQRLEVKLKLQALGKEVLERAGDLPSLEAALTDERPSVFNRHQVRNLRWFAVRPADERRFLRQVLPDPAPGLALAAEPEELGRHLQFLMQIESGFFVSGLCWPQAARVDRENMRRLLEQAEPAARLRQELEGLSPAGWWAGGEQISAEQVVEVLSASGAPDLLLAQRIDSGRVCQAGAALGEELSRFFSRLALVYRRFGWSRQNDRLGLGQKHKQQLAQAGGELRSGERVRIISGLAAGKTAVIEEVDKRGTVRVRLGNISLSLKASDVERHEAH